MGVNLCSLCARRWEHTCCRRSGIRVGRATHLSRLRCRRILALEHRLPIHRRPVQIGIGDVGAQEGTIRIQFRLDGLEVVIDVRCSVGCETVVVLEWPHCRCIGSCFLHRGFVVRPSYLAVMALSSYRLLAREGGLAYAWGLLVCGSANLLLIHRKLFLGACNRLKPHLLPHLTQ